MPTKWYFHFPPTPSGSRGSFFCNFSLYSTYTVTLRTLYLKIQILGGFFLFTKNMKLWNIYFVLCLYIRRWFNLFKAKFSLRSNFRGGFFNLFRSIYSISKILASLEFWGWVLNR